MTEPLHFLLTASAALLAIVCGGLALWYRRQFWAGVHLADLFRAEIERQRGWSAHWQMRAHQVTEELRLEKERRSQITRRGNLTRYAARRAQRRALVAAKTAELQAGIGE